MDQNKMPLVEALAEYKKSGRISMHIPGHKENPSAAEELADLLGKEVLLSDITEISGFDDYHKPEGLILQAQELAAEAFGAEESFFLVNGTTSGIMAAVAACAGEKERILIEASCHKSVMRGLILSGAEPVYIKDYVDAGTGLPGGISPEETERLLEASKARAVVLSNPSYYGTYSDLKKIVQTAHRHGAVVIADEAHGCHLRFAPQKCICDAMSCGADISVQSLHKMAGSLTQTSLLHVRGDLVDRDRLAYYIRFLTSTSPSYLLMASLDAARQHMALKGRYEWKQLVDLSDEYSCRLGEIAGMECIRDFQGPEGALRPLEKGRLLISAAKLGISGWQLDRLLSSSYGIDMEMSDDRFILAVLGPGSSKSDLDRLEEALKDISKNFCELQTSDNNSENQSCGAWLESLKNQHGRALSDSVEDRSGPVSSDAGKARTGISPAAAAGISPELKDLISRTAALDHICEITPREAAMSHGETIDLDYAAERTAAAEIALYPPGIPLVIPGEKISLEIIGIIKEAVSAGLHIHGVEASGQDRGKLLVRVAEDRERSMLFDCIF